MGLKYGDAVTLIQKSPDGKSLRRVNAIVLRSDTQRADKSRSSGFALNDAQGKALPEGEYLDLAFPRDIPEGHSIKASDMGGIFQPSYVTPPWKEGAFKGWQTGSATAVVPDSAPLPSAEDLDAVAADQKAAEATSGAPIRLKANGSKKQ
jgi:hypothetical protein